MISLFANGTAFWVAAAAGLAGFIAYQLSDEPPVAPEVRAATTEAVSDDEAADVIAVARFPSADLVDEIVARPLFSPSRRPAPPQASQAPAIDVVSDEKPTLELIGTMLAGDSHIALFKHATDGLIRLKPGQSFEGWTIVDVENQRVSLENDDGLEVLTLRKDLVRPKAPPMRNKTWPGAEKGNQDGEAGEATAPNSEPIRRPI